MSIGNSAIPVVIYTIILLFAVLSAMLLMFFKLYQKNRLFQKTINHQRYKKWLKITSCVFCLLIIFLVIFTIVWRKVLF